MKKVLIIAVGLMLLALPALTCGGGASGNGGAGNTVAAGAGCPDGWEAVRMGGIYHGVAFEVAGSDCECLGDSDFCASFEGQLHGVNTVEAAWGRCGSDFFDIPNERHAMCTAGGWVTASWDGESNHVCAKWEPDHVIVTPGPSTGDAYILNGDGCPDSYTFVHAGGDYGGCVFEPDEHVLKVYCGGEFNRDITTYESGPVWRSDSEPSERGLQVFWPGGGFACVKER